MQISDKALVRLFKLDPIAVPSAMLRRCMGLLSDPADKVRLFETLGRRRPRSERERQVLLELALASRRGDLIGLIDLCGGFEGQRPA